MRFPRTTMQHSAALAFLAAVLAGCSPGVGGGSADGAGAEDAHVPGDTASTAPYDGIAEDETCVSPAPSRSGAAKWPAER